MNKFTPNKWVVIGIISVMLAFLLPVTILMFGVGDNSSSPADNGVLNQATTIPSGISSSPTSAPTTQSTTVPTTISVAPPTTVKPQGSNDPCASGKHTYNGGAYCIYCAKPNPNYDPCAKGHTYQNGYCIYCAAKDPSVTTPPTTQPPVTTTQPPVTTTTPPATAPAIDVNGTFKIAENGQAKAAIVIDYNCSDKEWAAAADLKSYLDRMTGVQIPLVYDSETLVNDKFYICVGDTTYGRAKGVSQPKGYPNNEKLVIKRVENFMILVGNDDGSFTGTEFAVTRFLEELGCGWFGIGDLWTVVPNKPNLTVGNLNITETPKFIARNSRLQDGSTFELSKRWYMGGVETHVGQHFMMAEVGNSHQTEHPEWYARYSNGAQRYPVDNQAAWPETFWHFCYSNSGLQQYVAQVVIKYFDDHPNCMVYSITPNDGVEPKVCQCAGCNAFANTTDLIINFANQVAKITKTKYPDRQVSILTYQTTMPAPTTSRPVESNVEIMFCMETTMTKRATDASYIMMWDAARNVSWASNFQTYIQRTNVQHRAIWKWLCIAADGNYAEWQYIPWVQGTVATDDHNYWKQNGVKYVFYDQGPLNAYREFASSTALRWPLWYVAQKGCWVDGKTGQQLLGEACQKLYGSGASAMLNYYMALAKASEECNTRSYAWIPCHARYVYTSSQISNIDAKISAAEGMLEFVTEEQRARMQNQINLWKTAKTKI